MSTVDDRFIEFSLNDEKFTFPLLLVKEVIRVPETTEVPNSPPYHIGVMNLRGQIISILDLKKRIGLKKGAHDEAGLEESAVIIVEINNFAIGVVVDSVNKVSRYNDEDLTSIEEISSDVKNHFINGLFQSENGFVIYLDLYSTLNIKEFSQAA